MRRTPSTSACAAPATRQHPAPVRALQDVLEPARAVLERRPDPSDGRAKLVALTPAGGDAIRAGRAIIAGIEADYAHRIGAERFATMCWALQDLLDDLNGAPVRGAPEPGPSGRS